MVWCVPFYLGGGLLHWGERNGEARIGARSPGASGPGATPTATAIGGEMSNFWKRIPKVVKITNEKKELNPQKSQWSTEKKWKNGQWRKKTRIQPEEITMVHFRWIGVRMVDIIDECRT